MVHEEYVRMVPHADTAVLFIHGIVGTPNHFRDLIPLVELVPESWSVCNLLLDGHGKSVEDFANTSIENWHSQVWGTFEKLSRTHERVILVAHSMGTLFYPACCPVSRKNPMSVSACSSASSEARVFNHMQFPQAGFGKAP